MYIFNEVLDVIKELSINNFKQLSEDDSASIIDLILHKYTNQKKYQFPLWEYFNSRISVRDEDAWNWIQDFKNNGPYILLFEYCDEKRAFEFDEIEDIVRVLNDSFGFVFYITSKNSEYILCYNDHDFLIVCGSAEEWLYKHSLTNYSELREFGNPKSD
jgi:hypothetical protein